MAEMYTIMDALCCCACKTVVTYIIKHPNNFEIILMLYFTCNLIRNENKIISAVEGVLKLFQNYFGDNEHVRQYL